jgi:hypothetical protein
MTQNPNKTSIYEYRITSVEMRSLDQNIRQVILGRDESGTLQVTGEVPGCGEECNANLSDLILEFVMSCEGCGEPDVLDQYLGSFCAKISQAVLIETVDIDVDDHLRSSIETILTSMNGEHLLPEGLVEGLYGFDKCPICFASERMGIQRGLANAHRTFFKLCEDTIFAISTEYTITPIDDGIEPGHSLKFKLVRV